MNWFSLDSAIKGTWLGGATSTLRQEFFGSMNSASNRKFVIYFTDLSAGKYEILSSPILTHGVSFSVGSYSLGSIGTLLYSTLFNIGGGGGGMPPSNIKAYVSIAYRDTNGNLIYNKDGKLATPKDTIIDKIVYSGTSAHSVTTNISAEMNWTQVTGYRYKGYLVKYGGGSSGYYGIYNKPSEMTVTTNSTVSVNSSFSYGGFGVSVVFYYEPVNIIAVQHRVENDLINTNKNVGKFLIPTVTNYDVSNSTFAPKKFESLNKNFWPGYILTGCTIYANSISDSNIIAKQVYDVNTTTKMNSKDDAKRYITLLTALNSANDISRCSN